MSIIPCFVTGIDLFQKDGEAWAVKVGSGITVISEVSDVPEAFGSGVVFQVLFLIRNGIRLAFLLIVP
jgi:hypothetical protein